MPVYDELVIEIQNSSSFSFSEGTERLKDYVDALNKADISEILLNVGAIPQSVKPSSTEEKLYSKATDIILARCFDELGLDGRILESRGNSADVIAKSRYYGYSLVADSKAMRLSRTAKNQKDFKVGALGDNWIRDDNTFAVLCCPLYQYPVKSSQIYEQALNNRTCFFSWEYLKFLIDSDIQESDVFSLEPIWSYVTRLSRMPGINRQENFFPKIEENMCKRINQTTNSLKMALNKYNNYIAQRAILEKKIILTKKISDLCHLTREQAIATLVEQEEKKTGTLDKLIERLQRSDD